MAVAPTAKSDDGLVDVVLVGDVSRRVLATALLPRVYGARTWPTRPCGWCAASGGAVRSIHHAIAARGDGEIVDRPPRTLRAATESR